MPQPVIPSEDAIRAAGEAIRKGQLVAFPTETVYGLGADATSSEAVAGIFAAKGRPRFNPLIIHVADLAAAQALGRFNAVALRLAEACWPGPLTLVVPKAADCPVADLATAGLDTIALRVPDNDNALALLRAADRPIAAPSANRSGHVSPTTAAHAASDLGEQVAMILDGGPSAVGVESTVLDATGAELILLRPGGLSRDDIERITGKTVEDGGNHDATAADNPRAPGQLLTHYAPAARVRLNVSHTAGGEALLAFGPDVPAHDGAMINLSETGDLVEAAGRLFAALRALDAGHRATIAVMPIPGHGLGEAINDRLRRAAAAR